MRSGAVRAGIGSFDALSQLFHTDAASPRLVSRLSHPLVQIATALLLTAGWVGAVLTGTELGTVATVAVSGVAVLGASFLLAWGDREHC